MARKDSVSEWDLTAGNNDNVAGINIAEGCAAANLNNAMRSIMAQIKAYTLIAEPAVAYSVKSSNYTAVLADKNALFRFTSSATLTLTAAATLLTNWHCMVMADGATVTIDADASETINGATTLEIVDGAAAFIICTGATFFAITFAPQDVLDLKLDALQPYATVASATETDIGAATSQNVTITGTTTITSFGTADAGTTRNVVFSGALTLTHNATSLILPFGADITTAARASIRAVSLGSGNWQVTDYQPAAAYNPTLTIGSGLSSSGSLAEGAMSIALDVYSGTSSSNTNYPVGTAIAMVYAEVNRAAVNTVHYSTGNPTDFVSLGGVALAGTWNGRGRTTEGNSLMQRTL